MTLNGVIFIMFILGIAAFGLYAAYHREDNKDRKHHFKVDNEHA